MPMVGKRVTNVLMTSASDAGVGGVQVVFRDLVTGSSRVGGRSICSTRPRCPA